MPTKNTSSAPRASYYAYTECYRLLEATGGTGHWKLVGYQDRPLGYAERVQVTPFAQTTGKGVVAGVLYTLERLYLEMGHALLLLQGELLQKLVGPNYVFCGGQPAPAYEPRPHLRNVRLASITQVPAEMTLPEVALLLRAKE